MAAPKSTPKDAQVMQAILKEMGVTDYEPRVVNQMLEFAYRYVTDILDDAKVYSNHGNKKNIDVDDIKLAIQCRLDHSFTTPPPRDLLMDVARHKNKTPLPLIKPYTGPKLPPDRYCLSSSNYRLKSLKKPRVQINTQPRVQIQGGVGTSLVTPRINIQQSSGRQLGLGSNALTLVTRGVSQPTVTIRPSAPAPKMPIIRVTPGLGAQQHSASTPTPNIVTTLSTPLGGGGVKRKLEDDDDYDNV